MHNFLTELVSIVEFLLYASASTSLRAFIFGKHHALVIKLEERQPVNTLLEKRGHVYRELQH